MARVWKHWPDGVETEWPSGSLPDPDSIFRADFLNQFIGWIRYLSDMEGEAVSTPFAVAGETIVQTAEFWNALMFEAGDDWLAVTADQLVPETIVADGEAKLNDSAEYAATAIGIVSTGDVIQPYRLDACPMRIRMLRLRARIDLCVALRVAGAASCGSVLYQDWRNFNGSVSLFTESAGAGGAANAWSAHARYGADVLGGLSENVRVESPRNLSVLPGPAPARGCLVYASDNGAALDAAGKWPWAYPWLPADKFTAPIYALTDDLQQRVVAGITAGAVEPDGTVVLPTWVEGSPDYWLGAVGYETVAAMFEAWHVPLDVLPAAYQPTA
jgi:hypothetical protein